MLPGEIKQTLCVCSAVCSHQSLDSRLLKLCITVQTDAVKREKATWGVMKELHREKWEDEVEGLTEAEEKNTGCLWREDSWWRQQACKQTCYFLTIPHNILLCLFVFLSSCISPPLSLFLPCMWFASISCGPQTNFSSFSSTPSSLTPLSPSDCSPHFSLISSPHVWLLLPLPSLSLSFRFSTSVPFICCSLSVILYLFISFHPSSVRPQGACGIAFMHAESAAFLLDVLVSLSYRLSCAICCSSLKPCLLFWSLSFFLFEGTKDKMSGIFFSSSHACCML